MINLYTSLLTALLDGVSVLVNSDCGKFFICFMLIGFVFRLFLSLTHIRDFNDKIINRKS